MHNLIIDKIKLNDNTDDHFEELQRGQHNIFEENENTKNNGFFGDNNNEKSLEMKNKDIDKKLVSLYRLHSSKFHKQKDVKLKDDLLNMRLNLLKKSDIEKLKSKNNSIRRLRQNIAFKFRFMNKLPNKSISPKKKKISIFKKQNEKMNKILKISKSIPDVLYKEIKSMKTEEKNKVNNTNNTENVQRNYENGINSSFKACRYSGNIYDYYKSNVPLYLNNNIFNKNPNISNNISSKFVHINNEDKHSIYSYDKNQEPKHHKDINKNENFNGKHNKIKINKIIYRNEKGDSMIKLSSLFY